MTLNQLIYFQKIAQLQHYRQAAIELNVSQPSLSRSMSALEAELDIVLFEHSGRNITLTKYGRLFLEHTDRILSEVDALEKRMKQLAGNGGHIDIAYVFPLASHYIPHTVRSFLNLKQNREITFSFKQAHTYELIEGLKNDKYDVVFGSYMSGLPSIHFVPILRQEMVVITALDHPLAKLERVDFDVLGQYPVIGYDKFSGLGLHTKAIYRERGVSPQIVCDCPDEYSIASLVSENFGIGFVANVADIASANVKILPITGEPIVHTVYMAYRKDRYLIPAAREFIRFVQKSSD